jgi:hypothetical protein
MSKRTKALFLIAGLLSLVSIGIISTRPTSAQAQGDKPVEEAFKNLQVLKGLGLRQSQLSNLMNFMAVSIGEKCEFCHVFNGKDPKTGYRNWIYESDEKPEKQTARRMLQMVLTINGSNKGRFHAELSYVLHLSPRSNYDGGIANHAGNKSGHEPEPNPPAPRRRGRDHQLKRSLPDTSRPLAVRMRPARRHFP